MTNVKLFQPASLKRSTTLPVSELTKLFVEGDKRRNEVSVDFKCCAYSTGKITIVRNSGTQSTFLNVILEGKA